MRDPYDPFGTITRHECDCFQHRVDIRVQTNRGILYCRQKGLKGKRTQYGQSTEDEECAQERRFGFRHYLDQKNTLNEPLPVRILQTYLVKPGYANRICILIRKEACNWIPVAFWETPSIYSGNHLFEIGVAWLGWWNFQRANINESADIFWITTLLLDLADFSDVCIPSSMQWVEAFSVIQHFPVMRPVNTIEYAEDCAVLCWNNICYTAPPPARP